jgi:hypothetical protein
VNGCDRKRWILRAAATASLSSGESSSMPRIAMMSRQLLVASAAPTARRASCCSAPRR